MINSALQYTCWKSCNLFCIQQNWRW